MTGRAAATRYARALFDVAVREGADVDAIGTDVAAFAELMIANPALGRVFANPAIPAGRKRAVVEQLLSASPVSPMVSRLLLMLAERDRLMLVSAIADAYRARLLEHAQVVRAEVTTAMPVPADRLAALLRRGGVLG